MPAQRQAGSPDWLPRKAMNESSLYVQALPLVVQQSAHIITLLYNKVSCMHSLCQVLHREEVARGPILSAIEIGCQQSFTMEPAEAAG